MYSYKIVVLSLLSVVTQMTAMLDQEPVKKYAEFVLHDQETNKFLAVIRCVKTGPLVKMGVLADESVLADTKNPLNTITNLLTVLKNARVYELSSGIIQAKL